MSDIPNPSSADLLRALDREALREALRGWKEAWDVDHATQEANQFGHWLLVALDAFEEVDLDAAETKAGYETACAEVRLAREENAMLEENHGKRAAQGGNPQKRFVGLSKQAYEDLRRWCRVNGVSMYVTASELIAAALARLPADQGGTGKEKKPRRRRPTAMAALERTEEMDEGRYEYLTTPEGEPLSRKRKVSAEVIAAEEEAAKEPEGEGAEVVQLPVRKRVRRKRGGVVE